MQHCRERVSKRYAPAQVPQVVDHGVPLFLAQLVHTLETEQTTTVRMESEPRPDEFRTLNRCLDEAIADAVTAFADERENALLDQAMHLHDRLGALAEEQRRLVDIALQTLAAIQTGNVGATGATGGALTRTLIELRHIIETTLPEIRLISGMTTTPRKG
jgi:hypothetical protein